MSSESDGDNSNKNVVVHVLFIRHCESCANIYIKKLEDLENEKNVHSGPEHSKYFERGYLIEPLCTRKGVIQALAAGSKVQKMLEKYEMKAQLRSSVLVRAMETCKLISHGISKNLLASKFIIRDPNISETWGDDEFDPEFRKSENPKDDKFIGSGGTTTVTLSDSNAKMLNKRLSNIGLPIRTGLADNKRIEYGCGGERCAINRKEFESKEETEYTLFKENVLSTYDSDVLNVVVGHGWYISQIVNSVKSKRDETVPDDEFKELKRALFNTQGVLIKFTFDPYDPASATSELVDLLPDSFDAEIPFDKLPKQIQDMFVTNDEFVDCNYKPNFGLKPECSRCKKDEESKGKIINKKEKQQDDRKRKGTTANTQYFKITNPMKNSHSSTNKRSQKQGRRNNKSSKLTQRKQVFTTNKKENGVSSRSKSKSKKSNNAEMMRRKENPLHYTQQKKKISKSPRRNAKNN